MLLNCRTLLGVLEADEVGHGVAQAGLGEGPAEENGQLSLVEIGRDCALIGWIMMLLCQLSYAIKTQLKAPKGTYLSLCIYGIRVSIIIDIIIIEPAPCCQSLSCAVAEVCLKGQLVSCSALASTATLSGQPRSPCLQGREIRPSIRSRPRLGDSRKVC